MKYADLNQTQRIALVDIVARGGLYRMRAGYEGSLHQPHRHATIVALTKRGLCRLKPGAGCMGAVKPTAQGRKIIIAEFGGNTYGALVTIVDSTPRKRGKR